MLRLSRSPFIPPDSGQTQSGNQHKSACDTREEERMIGKPRPARHTGESRGFYRWLKRLCTSRMEWMRRRHKY